MTTFCLSHQNTLIDLQYDLCGSTWVFTWPWPEVRFWNLSFKVKLCMIRRALTREARWCKGHLPDIFFSFFATMSGSQASRLGVWSPLRTKPSLLGPARSRVLSLTLDAGSRYVCESEVVDYRSCSKQCAVIATYCYICQVCSQSCCILRADGPTKLRAIDFTSTLMRAFHATWLSTRVEWSVTEHHGDERFKLNRF